MGDNAKPVPIDDEQDKDLEVEVPETLDDTPNAREVNIDEEEQNDQEFKKLDNKAFAAMRKEATEAKRAKAELEKRLKDLETRREEQVVTPMAPPITSRQREHIGGVPVPESKQEWDDLARRDWQMAVDMRSSISARRVQEEVRRADTATRTMEDAKQRVLQRHPELADNNSEKTKIFLQVLEANPEYRTMSKGPVFAMRDMEDEMEARGMSREQIFDNRRAAAQSEATRTSRASLTTSGRMPEKQGRTVTMSKDDLEFCKNQGIDPKEYAKQKLELENARKGAQL